MCSLKRLHHYPEYGKLEMRSFRCKIIWIFILFVKKTVPFINDWIGLPWLWVDYALSSWVHLCSTWVGKETVRFCSTQKTSHMIPSQQLHWCTDCCVATSSNIRPLDTSSTVARSSCLLSSCLEILWANCLHYIQRKFMQKHPFMGQFTMITETRTAYPSARIHAKTPDPSGKPSTET
jgi:hypothetical protein